jgi:flagellar biosynthetic protein FlhB
MLLPLFITPLLVAVASLVPGGWLLSAKNLQPKFSRLSPQQNLSKFFKAKHYGDLVMSVLKVSPWPPWSTPTARPMCAISRHCHR